MLKECGNLVSVYLWLDCVLKMLSFTALRKHCVKGTLNCNSQIVNVSQWVAEGFQWLGFLHAVGVK